MKERKTSEKEGICDGNNLKNISKGYVNTKIHVYNLLTKQGEMDNYFSELSGSLAIWVFLKISINCSVAEIGKLAGLDSSS